MLKTVVFGSHGFLGEHLYNKLQSLGQQVIRGDREGNIPDKVAVLYDLASYGNLWGQNDLKEIERANVTRVGKLLSQTKMYDKAIVTSTSSVSMGHTTPYANAKRKLETIAEEYGAVIIRPYSIYGSGDYREHLIPKVFRSCLENEPMELDPSPTHDYIWVEDLVDLYIDPPSKLVEAGTGKGTTNGEVVRLIQKITGKIANITAIKKGLRAYDQPDWRAPMPVKENMVRLEDGLRKIYDRIHPH